MSIFYHNSIREQRLQFMQGYRDAFDVEPKFPIPLFEEAVLDIDGSCGIEPTCNVKGDRLFAGDFQVANYGHTWPRSLIDASKFIEKVENRIDVQISRNLLDRFSAQYMGSSNIENNTIGIDVRSTLQDSLVKIYMHIHPGEQNEDLVRTAIALDGAEYSPELTEVLIRDVTIIGFNLFLDGRSNIEIWAGSSAKTCKHPGITGSYLAAYIRKNFSNQVNSIFNGSEFIAASFSKTKIAPLFHFHFFDIKDIPKYFLFNSLGSKIYDFCLGQDCVTYAGVTATEKDLESDRLENYGFFYNQSDTCQSDLDRVRFTQLSETRNLNQKRISIF